jgi:aspergillopepsin I
VKPQQQTTFFDTVKDTLAKPLFTCDLKKGDAGSYTFGYIDSSKYTGSIGYVSVDDSQGFWQFTAGGYAVGSDNATEGSIGTSIADTGTSLVYLPSNVVRSYYSGIQGARYDSSQGGYTLPCTGNAPDFTVAIGGKSYTIPGAYIDYAPLTSGSSTCFGGLQANTGIGFSIFGDVFLKAVYAIFDVSTGSPRLGFAAQS